MNRARELRTAFDGSFAEPLHELDRVHLDLLAIRLGGDPYAVLLSEIASTHADLPVVRLPTPASELLGVAAIRSSIVPVYDLRALVGAPLEGAPRWIAVAGGTGYAFDGFDGSLRVFDELRDRRPRREIRGAIAHDGVRRPVIDLTEIGMQLRQRWSKEP